MKSSLSSQATRDPLNRKLHLPRLAREHYQGDAVVFWTLSVFDRARGWLTPGFHSSFRELMFHASAREGLICPAYCLMPDHIHFVWMGLKLDSDQLNAMAFLRTHLEAKLAPARFQPQAHDKVIRPAERKHDAFAGVCTYIAENPVRAGLAKVAGGWTFSGCVVPGFPKLHPCSDDFWAKFWRIYGKLRQPEAGNILRPPFPEI